MRFLDTANALDGNDMLAIETDQRGQAGVD